MKRTLLSLAVTVAFAVMAVAAEKEAEQTLTGDAKCAKCALNETKKCQTAIQVQEDGKTITYYLTDNKVARDFHEEVCQGTKRVTATGTVKEEDGKRLLTASKIESK